MKRTPPTPSQLLSEVGRFARYLATGKLDRPDTAVEITEGRAAGLVALYAPAPALRARRAA